MFSKNRKNGEDSKGLETQDKVAKGIAGFLLSIQNRFTSFMSERVKNLSRQSKKICLAIFCLMFGGVSVHVFIGAFRDSKNSERIIIPDRVAVPKYYDQIDSEIKEPSVGEGDIIRINRFRKYMDSLSSSVKGRLVHDSILKARPGLTDSITVIEEIYYSQSK